MLIASRRSGDTGRANRRVAAGSLDLRYIQWPTQYVRFKRNHPMTGAWADWGRGAAARRGRHALQKEREAAEGALRDDFGGRLPIGAGNEAAP